MMPGEQHDAGKMDCHGQTEPGNAQQLNTDQFFIADMRRSLVVHQTNLASDDCSRRDGETHGQLLMVAGGVGKDWGHHASALAVDAAASQLLRGLDLNCGAQDEEQCAALLGNIEAALWESQSRLLAESSDSPEGVRFRSTLTLAYVCWPTLLLAHVGDCRCYLFRNLRLKQLTCDHTFAQKMADRGVLQAQTATSTRWDNVLWNVLGASNAELAPDLLHHELLIGDTLLLCTDGLTRHVSDRQIGKILAEDRSAEESCRRLVQAAKRSGGSDSLSVVVARFRSFDTMQSHLSETVEFDAIEEFEGGAGLLATESEPGLAASDLLEAQEPSENTEGRRT